jgi:hypothetical protein
MDKEFIANFKQSNGKTTKLLYSHFRFEIAIPYDYKEEQEY